MQESIYMDFLDVVVWYSWISFINSRLFSRIIQLLSIPHPMNWNLQNVIQPLQYWIQQKYDLSLFFIQEIAYVNHSGAVTPDICALVLYLVFLLICRVCHDVSKKELDYAQLWESICCRWTLSIVSFSICLFSSSRLFIVSMSTEEDSVFRILVATDNHLGYK